MTMIQTKKWRFGVKRWVVLGLLLLALTIPLLVGGPFAPVVPAVILPGEEIGPGWQLVPAFEINGWHFDGLSFTNTILATLIADLFLILLFVPAVFVFSRSKRPVPSNAYLIVEMAVEFVWNMVRGMLEEKWARRALPVVATIFFLILAANLTKMLPVGYESIGWLKEVDSHHAGEGAYLVDSIGAGWYALDKPRTEAALEALHAGESGAGEVGHGAETEIGPVYELVPFLRGAATDINFPLALAVFSFCAIQVFGVWALRWGYPGKFFVFRGLISKPLFGLIDFFVGILEFVLEFVKIISLTLRLFGNIFAGGLILLILGSLVPAFIPAGLAAFELFVGVIQAYVFAILTLIFISLAVQSHSSGEHAESH